MLLKAKTALRLSLKNREARLAEALKIVENEINSAIAKGQTSIRIDVTSIYFIIRPDIVAHLTTYGYKARLVNIAAENMDSRCTLTIDWG